MKQQPQTYDEWVRSKFPEGTFVTRESMLGTPVSTPESQKQAAMPIMKTGRRCRALKDGKRCAAFRITDGDFCAGHMRTFKED